MFRYLLLLFSFVFVRAAGAVAPLAHDQIKPSWSYVDQKLRAARFKKKFIKALRDMYEPKNFEQVLELNVLLFLRKRDDHGVQVTPDAVKMVKSFMRENKDALDSAEKQWGVPPAVIASLLFIETRHGENRGHFHVASVYMHLLQGPRTGVIKHLQKHGREFAEAEITPAQKKEIAARAGRKAEWAIEELRALEKSYGRSPHIVKNMRGSFSGAFGIPQFLPSSYWHWARTTTPKGVANLDLPSDAIESVAFYLKDNGWKRARKTYVKALMKYNNSADYANAILKLADEADPKMPRDQKRVPANGHAPI